MLGILNNLNTGFFVVEKNETMVTDFHTVVHCRHHPWHPNFFIYLFNLPWLHCMTVRYDGSQQMTWCLCQPRHRRNRVFATDVFLQPLQTSLLSDSVWLFFSMSSHRVDVTAYCQCVESWMWRMCTLEKKKKINKMITCSTPLCCSTSLLIPGQHE